MKTPITLREQAALMSSGTMATLTGLRKYTAIDARQAEFILFCGDNEGKFETWQEAWRKFDGFDETDD